MVLDGVGDVMTIKKNREILQGRPKVCKGGQSATMMYSYDYTLCKRGVVATFDLSADNLSKLETDHWLSNPLNVIHLRLSEKAFEEPSAPSVPDPRFVGVGPVPPMPTFRSPQSGAPLTKRPR